LTPLILPPAKNNFQVYLSKAEGLYGGLYTINPELSTETVANVRLILAGKLYTNHTEDGDQFPALF
jgi:hypothetical protein